MIHHKYKILVVSLVVLCVSVITHAQPYIPCENLEPARSSIISFRKGDKALKNIADSSENYSNLSGEWRVKYYNSSQEVAQSDYAKSNDIESWGESVTVPSLWQIERSAVAVYSQSAYPFLSAEPTKGEFPIPTNTPCALYQRNFTVPFDYLDKKLYLNIGAASAKVTLYINEQMVGFSTDSKNPAEFEISEYTHRGQNRLSLLVEEFSGGSWLEDGGGWRLSGINRDVYLLAQPKIRMRDVLVSTSLDPTITNGLLETALLLKTELLNPHTVTVYYDLYDPSGKIIRKENKEVTIGMRREDTIRFHSSITKVEKWNSETPNLYTLVYSVKREGRYTEIASAKVGFREASVRNGSFIINGKAPKIKGVNIEEFSATKGNILPREELKNQLLAMRSIGINAVRTGGYPMPQYFYDLTDSIGFYVVNVANINTQGLLNSTQRGYSLSNNPQWCDIFTQRVVATYERTKHNASVVAIALGENAGNGYNMYESYLELKRRNPNLVVIYDGADAEWNTDIISPLRPAPNEIEKLQKRGVVQPIIPSRVSFNKSFWQNEALQGAFIDRWCSQDLEPATSTTLSRLKDNYSMVALRSGKIDQYSAQNNLEEIANCFANFSVEIKNKKEEPTLKIQNNLEYANLNEFALKYRKITKGKPSEWITLKIDCKAGETVEVLLENISKANSVEIEIGDLFKTNVKL